MSSIRSVVRRFAVAFAPVTVIVLTVPSGALAAGGYTFNIHPDASAPGVKGIEHATNIGAMYALLGAGLGAVLSILMIAVSKGLHLERLHTRGKEGFIVSLGSAFAIATVTAFLNAAYGLV